MGSATNYLRDKVLDHTLGTTPYTHPSQSYLALFLNSAPSTVAGGGTEVSTTGTNYARIAINFGAASGDSTTNSNQCLFVNTGTDFGTIGAYAIYDALTSGNMLYYGSTDVIAIGDGDSFNVAIADITVRMA